MGSLRGASGDIGLVSAATVLVIRMPRGTAGAPSSVCMPE